MRSPRRTATPTLPMIQATTTAHSRNGTTAMPTTDAARMTDTGPMSSRTSRPVRKALNGRAAIASAHVRTVSMKSSASTSEARKTKKTMPQTQPSLGTIGRPSSRPSVIHGTTVRSAVGNRIGAHRDVLAPGAELGRRVETAADHHQIPVHGGAGLHGHVPADHDERSVDDRRRPDPHGAEDDDDVAADVAVDGRRAEDDDGVVDRLSLLERVVLADAQDVAAPAAEDVIPWIHPAQPDPAPP